MTDRELLELAARAAKMVDYNPETGVMVWREKQGGKDSSRWNARYSGKECGTLEVTGYRRLLFRFEIGKTFKIRAHRLAWFIVHGVMPSGEIDHINQKKADNRISNLRDVPKKLNQRNVRRKRSNTSGVTGVTWHKQHRKWCAQVNFDGKHRHVGLFKELDDAETAIRKFRAQHGFTEIHGGPV